MVEITELVCGLFSAVEEVEERSSVILCLFSVMKIAGFRANFLVQTSLGVNETPVEVFWSKTRLAPMKIYTNWFLRKK